MSEILKLKFIRFISSSTILLFCEVIRCQAETRIGNIIKTNSASRHFKGKLRLDTFKRQTPIEHNIKKSSDLTQYKDKLRFDTI